MEELARFEGAGDAGAAEDVDGVGRREGVLAVDDDAGEEQERRGTRQRQQEEQPAGPTTEAWGGQSGRG